MRITGTIVICMGIINLCTNMHSQIPPARGGKGGGAKHRWHRCSSWGGWFVPVVENNGGFSSRRSRVVAEQE